MAAASAFGAGVGVATFGAEVATSDAVKVTFVGARAARTSDAAVAVANSGAMAAGAVVGPAVAVPASNVAVVAALVMFNVTVEGEAVAVTSNAVVAVAVVTLNRGAAVAAGEPLRPVEVAVGVRTDRPAAIRSARPLIGRS
jgi:hypothetical protein